ncbi:MAG: AAA family ATPase [Phycisphaerales bacterium]
MQVARVCIRNFRCFGGSDEGWGLDWLANRDLNLLIGPNGCGKTSLVDAIDLALNWEGRTNRGLVSEYDFPWCDTTKTITIRVTLTDIGPVRGEFQDVIQFIDRKTGELIDETGVVPLEDQHEQAVIIEFEAKRYTEDGEIHERWLLPKFKSTEYEHERELSRKQHQAISYFRIRPLVSGGAFTLGEYSALGRHLRKLNYALGNLPDKLRPTQRLPECRLHDLHCEDCTQESCKSKVVGSEGEAQVESLGTVIARVASRAQSMLGDDAWPAMGSSLGPRYGGIRASLAAITLGLRPLMAQGEEFIPFERLSSGEKYAMSFALATQQLPGSASPIIIMEEPETSLYPCAVGKIMDHLHRINSPQVIITSHSESVIRRFGLKHILRIDSQRKIKRIDTIASDAATLWELEKLVMPGWTSALFVDKILVLEGGGDAFTSGALDRLAGLTQESFASKGWTVFSANSANKVPGTVKAMKRLNIKVAALLDADDTGREVAEQTKDECPVFTYERPSGDSMTLELVLFNGLDKSAQRRAAVKFQKYAECTHCIRKTDIRNCVSKTGCGVPGSIDKQVLKSELRDSCLQEYVETKTFPPAFVNLISKLDDAHAGTIHELPITA